MLLEPETCGGAIGVAHEEWVGGEFDVKEWEMQVV